LAKLEALGARPAASIVARNAAPGTCPAVRGLPPRPIPSISRPARWRCWSWWPQRLHRVSTLPTRHSI